MISHADWYRALTEAVVSVDDSLLRRAAEMVLESRLVLCAGNGGSSALAAHAAQAFAKPDYAPGGGRPAVNLTDNMPSITAHANDGGWEAAMTEAGRTFLERVPGCVLFAISSSGKSKNICKLAQLARDHGARVFSMTGFDGEPLKSLSDLSLHVKSYDYEIVEPAHDALLHRIQAFVRMLGMKTG